MLNIPITLTLVRFVISLGIVPFIFSSLWATSAGHYGLLALVLLCGLTDFLDGFLARRLGAVTSFGRVLDPLADKLFFASFAVLLVSVGRLSGALVFVLLAREFVVMTIREYAVLQGFVVPVAWGGKVKTALQVLLLSFAMISQPSLGEYLLWWVLLVASWASGMGYLITCVRSVRRR